MRIQKMGKWVNERIQRKIRDAKKIQRIETRLKK